MNLNVIGLRDALERLAWMTRLSPGTRTARAA
jgi:hypothetical protein